jgi:hypothetical protein
VQYGPASTVEQSMTVSPASGPGLALPAGEACGSGGMATRW